MAYIKKLASGRWQAQIRLKGLKPIARSFDTKTKANQFARQVEGDTELARKLGAPTVGVIRFPELVERYMAQWTGKDPNVGQRLAFWRDLLGDLPVTLITPHRVDDGIAELAKRKGRGGRLMSGSSINRYKSTLSALLSWYASEHKVADYRNPVQDAMVARYPENPAKDRFLTPAEQQALLDACRRSGWDRLYLFALLLLTTGCRKGEALGLHWRDVDLQARTASLRSTKNGRPRLLPLTGKVVEELMRHRGKPDHLVFQSTVSKTTPFDVRKSWARAVADAGIGHLRIHDLRHTAASNLVRAGRSLFEVGTLLGHSSAAMTQRYSHLAVDDTRAMVDAVMGDLG